MQDEFDRIKRLPPYVFAEVNNLKAKLRSKGKDIIDFGMGNIKRNCRKTWHRKIFY